MRPEESDETTRRLGRLMGEALGDRSNLQPPPPPDLQSSEGVKLGKYLLRHRLGAGGMGEVWKAWDTQLDRWVALKTLKWDDPNDVARFLREARTAAQLRHPNVVPVYEVGEVGGRHFIAMQYLDGTTLLELQGGETRLLVELVRDAARALHAAHEAGVIHRDLKPTNLMVESGPPSGAGSSAVPRVYILDFGLAKQAAVDSSLSASGTLIGTPAYMPPEQAQGRVHEIDARSDVYSLGATLYHLLARRTPFSAPTNYEMLKKVVETEPIPLRRANPLVDRDLETIVHTCLQKDPARRYPAASALADDLSRWLSGEAVQARPPSLRYRVLKFAGRKKAMIIPGVAGLALALTVGGVFGTRWLQERAERRREEDRKREAVAAERRRAEERERALKELGSLWTDIVVAKQGFHNAAEDPQRVRRRILASVGRLGDFLARYPRLPEAYYVRSRGWQYLNATARAEKDARASIEIDAAFVPGYSLLAQILLARYRQMTIIVRTGPEVAAPSEKLLDEAERNLKRVRDLQPQGLSLRRWGLSKTGEDEIAEALTRALLAAHVEKDWSRAVTLLTEADRKTPSAEIRLWIAEGKRDVRERLEWLARALQWMPHFAEGYFTRSFTRIRTGDLTGAVSDLTEVLRINPDHEWAHLQRGSLFLKEGERLAEAGKPVEARGAWERAEEDFTRDIRKHPSRWFSYFKRGIARRWLGKADGAIQDYDRVGALRSPFTELHYNRGIAHVERGETDRAIAEFTQATILNPKHASAFENRATARYRKGDPRGALRDYERAEKLDPKDWSVYLNRARVYLHLGEPEKALADLEKALKRRPTLTKARLYRAVAYERLREFAKALAEYDRVLAVDRKDKRVWNNRGLLLVRTGDRKGAVEDFTQALTVDPDFVPALFNRGAARRDLSDLAGARADFDRAARLEPKTAKIFRHRGIVRAGLGDLDGADEDYTRAISLNAKYGLAYCNRAELRAQRGDRAGAIRDYRRALEVGLPSEKYRRMAEADLRKLEAD